MMKGVSCQGGYKTYKLPQGLYFLSLQGTALSKSLVEFYRSFMLLLSCRESSSALVTNAVQNLSYLAHMGGWGERYVKYAFTTNSNILCLQRYSWHMLSSCLGCHRCVQSVTKQKCFLIRFIFRLPFPVVF